MSRVEIKHVTIGKKVIIQSEVETNLVDFVGIVNSLIKIHGSCDVLVGGEVLVFGGIVDVETFFWKILLATKTVGVFVIHNDNQILAQVVKDQKVPVFRVCLKTGDVKVIGTALSTSDQSAKCTRLFTCDHYSFEDHAMHRAIYAEPLGSNFDRKLIIEKAQYTNHGVMVVVDGKAIPIDQIPIKSNEGTLIIPGVPSSASRYEKTFHPTCISNFVVANIACDIVSFNNLMSMFARTIESWVTTKREEPKMPYKCGHTFNPTVVYDGNEFVRHIDFNETSIALLDGDCDVDKVETKIKEEMAKIRTEVYDAFAKKEKGGPLTIIYAESKPPNTQPLTVHEMLRYAYFNLKIGFVVVTKKGEHLPIQEWMDSVLNEAEQRTTGTITIIISDQNGKQMYKGYWHENFHKDRNIYLAENVDPINSHALDISSIGTTLGGIITIGKEFCALVTDADIGEIKKACGNSDTSFEDCVLPFLKSIPSFKIIYGKRQNGETIEVGHIGANTLIRYIYVPAKVDSKQAQKLVGFTKMKLGNMLTQELIEETFLTDRAFGDHEELDIDVLKK